MMGDMHAHPETERLRLRRLTADDLDALVELDSDPEAMRYLTGGQPTPRELIRDENRFLGWVFFRPATQAWSPPGARVDGDGRFETVVRVVHDVA
jgi:RimJ/RimL family protein N-acetyltransferase